MKDSWELQANFVGMCVECLQTLEVGCPDMRMVQSVGAHVHDPHLMPYHSPREDQKVGKDARLVLAEQGRSWLVSLKKQLLGHDCTGLALCRPVASKC